LTEIVGPTLQADRYQLENDCDVSGRGNVAVSANAEVTMRRDLGNRLY
jgi:hypothetical protein